LGNTSLLEYELVNGIKKRRTRSLTEWPPNQKCERLLTLPATRIIRGPFLEKLARLNFLSNVKSLRIDKQGTAVAKPEKLKNWDDSAVTPVCIIILVFLGDQNIRNTTEAWW